MVFYVVKQAIKLTLTGFINYGNIILYTLTYLGDCLAFLAQNVRTDKKQIVIYRLPRLKSTWFYNLFPWLSDNDVISFCEY